MMAIGLSRPGKYREGPGTHCSRITGYPNFISQDFFHFFSLELVSKELNHFGVIAALFRQTGAHGM